MEQKSIKKHNKIIKVTLIIYCLIMLVCFISFFTVSGVTKDYSFIYGFLLCLAPSFIFVLVSLFFPITRLVDAKVGKSVIVWYVIGYVLKYAAIIGIPFIGLNKPDLFNKWVMLATTLIGPVFVIISKLIFANVVSKSSEFKPKIG